MKVNKSWAASETKIVCVHVCVSNEMDGNM